MCGAHKARTTPYHQASDGLVERFNITFLMMLAMFAGENQDDWDYLLPAVMMAYRLCLDNTHCLWTWASHVGIRPRRTPLKILMPCGSRTRWMWHMINGMSDACLLWDHALLPTT